MNTVSKKPFLPFREFADKWIEENVDNSLYRGGMKEYVREFVALVIRQHPSGGSMGTFLAYTQKMMEDYYAQLGSE